LGLNIKENHPQKLLKEILAWTEGQPFLTQKLCRLIVSLSQYDVGRKLRIPPGAEEFWIENVVRSHIIEKWESQDEPEHLRTIRDRILGNEQFAARLLGIYQQILQGVEVPADDSREQVELLLSGLVIKKQGFLKIKNRIYQEVFNLEWVGKKLAYLRPYYETFNAWIASNQKDESRLLRGQALIDAETWAHGKSLSNLDYRFLAASEELDRREMQQALEAERAKEAEARLAEHQKRLAQQKKSATIVTLLLVGMTIKLAISMVWGVSLLQKINALESQLKCSRIVHESKEITANSQSGGC
jgi:hypothetical protein